MPTRWAWFAVGKHPQLLHLLEIRPLASQVCNGTGGNWATSATHCIQAQAADRRSPNRTRVEIMWLGAHSFLNGTLWGAPVPSFGQHVQSFISFSPRQTCPLHFHLLDKIQAKMPPCRTRGIVKPMKYERTHEENQERAYIAASRRSDRCLEARMESARRASAIHEKRTGRALRITEADVVNEAMYEEVNDLPSQYRRLNAHLQTRSADFDRRLLAYLSSQIATRQALSDCWQGTESSSDAYIANPSMISHQTEPNYTHMSFDPPAQQIMHQQEQAYADSAESLFAFSLQQQNLHPIMTSSPSGPRSDDLSRIDSAVDMPMSSPGFHHPNDPRSNCQPFQATNRPSSDPLSSALPLSSQQLLSGSQFQHHHPNEGGNFVGTRRYSYNPNGRPSTTPVSPTPPQYTMSTGPAQISSSPSPLWLDAPVGVSPSPTHSGPPLQLHRDSPGIATHRHSRKSSARTGP